MAFELNSKIRDLKPYTVVSGDYPVRLDANESFISLPENIRQEISSAVASVNFNRYPDCRARVLCSAAAEFYGVSADNLVAGNGSDELIQIIISGFAQKGDTVLVLSPDFSMYSFYAEIAELNTLCLQKDALFNIDVDGLVAEIKRVNPRIVVLSNPCNPTGGILTAEDIEKISSCFDGLAVIDEAYMEFSQTSQSILKKCCEKDNVIVLKTCSKAFGMAAIRLGFCISNKKIVNAVLAVKSPYNVNSLTQAAGTVLFSHGDYLKDCISKISASAADLQKKIVAMGFDVVPSNTNFCVIKTEKATEIYEFLKNNGVLVRNFGSFLRITAGNSDENTKLLDCLSRF